MRPTFIHTYAKYSRAVDFERDPRIVSDYEPIYEYASDEDPDRGPSLSGMFVRRDAIRTDSGPADARVPSGGDARAERLHGAPHGVARSALAGAALTDQSLAMTSVATVLAVSRAFAGTVPPDPVTVTWKLTELVAKT